MIVAAIIEYSTDADLVNQHRPAHRAYLGELLQRDQLVASGPLTDAPGALIVYHADSIEAAEALLKADPFHQAGVFLKWNLRPWNLLFANPRLMPQPA